MVNNPDTEKKLPRLKVLFLPRWYPYDSDPMFGLFIERHALAISHLASVKVLFIHPVPDLKGGLNFRRENRSGIDTLCIHYNNVPYRFRIANLLHGSLCYLMANVRGYRLLYPDSERPDLCHVHILARPGFLALFLRTFRGIPFLITEHWSRYHPELNRYTGTFRKFATSLMARKASAVTAVTQHLKNSMMQCRIENPRFEILPNIVDTELFTTDKPTLLHDNRKTFVHISTFEDASKNISGMLRAVARLATKRTDFTFKLVGDGVDFQKLNKLASDLGLSSPTIEFTGLATDQQVAAHLNEARFLIMFSNYENQPVVIIESLACGRPVVATRVGGIPEMITQERGQLVSPGDEEALEKAIGYMLDNHQNYNQAELRKYAIATFGRAVIGSQLINLYTSILAKSASALNKGKSV